MDVSIANCKGSTRLLRVKVLALQQQIHHLLAKIPSEQCRIKCRGKQRWILSVSVDSLWINWDTFIPHPPKTVLKLLVFLKNLCLWVKICRCAVLFVLLGESLFLPLFLCVKILPVSDVLHNSICFVQYALSKWEQTDTRVVLSRAVTPEWIWGFQLVTRSSSKASVQAECRSCPAGYDA